MEAAERELLARPHTGEGDVIANRLERE